MCLHCLLALRTAELTAGGAGDGQAGMDVGEEGRRVLLDLPDVEAIAGVDAAGDDAGLEGTPQAADAVPAALADLNRVGEGNSGGKEQPLVGVWKGKDRSGQERVTYRGGPDLPLGASWI